LPKENPKCGDGWQYTDDHHGYKCPKRQFFDREKNFCRVSISLELQAYARDVARRLMRTKAFLKSREERKRVEMRFAHLKTHHGFERMRLRGLSGARDEFYLAAIVQNLKTMALRALGPPPNRRHTSFA
jgi:Transposase DDE domain